MEQTAERISFDFLPGLPIVVEPKATLMSSDAGILPLRQFDDQIGFTDRFVAGLHDPRDPALIDHGSGSRIGSAEHVAPNSVGAGGDGEVVRDGMHGSAPQRGRRRCRHQRASPSNAGTSTIGRPAPLMKAVSSPVVCAED